ncbi:sterile alpha motif domain-containing protein 11 isoform X2 [Ochotona curzoniae]|uniref:sterile alpha motif domain-containing protein 11 isoform X2 n=1 Tax=Ochotona curzoniae TaxID=130825 RepID=UPI001B34CD53|nr:sterile alpha motif domain-containing protein 11 isoform X2 [Ochotona curzoniae]
MSKGILQVHPPICDCPGCRISSPVNRGRLADKRTAALTPTRVLKKERNPSFSASDGDSDGSGPACGRRPGLKQEDDPHVHIMKRRVHTHWDVNISFRETSCSQDSSLPTLISSVHHSRHLVMPEHQSRCDFQRGSLELGLGPAGDLLGKRLGRSPHISSDCSSEKKARGSSPPEALLLPELGPSMAPEDHYRRLMSALSEAGACEDPQRFYHLGLPSHGRPAPWDPERPPTHVFSRWGHCCSPLPPSDLLRVRQEVAAAALRTPSGLDVHLPSSPAGQRRKQGLAAHREGTAPAAALSFSDRELPQPPCLLSPQNAPHIALGPHLRPPFLGVPSALCQNAGYGFLPPAQADVLARQQELLRKQSLARLEVSAELLRHQELEGASRPELLASEAALRTPEGADELQRRGALLVLKHSAAPLLALPPQGPPGPGPPSPPREPVRRAPRKGGSGLGAPKSSELKDVPGARLWAQDGSEDEPPRDPDAEDSEAASAPGSSAGQAGAGRIGAEGKGLFSGSALPLGFPYLHTGAMGSLCMDGDEATTSEDVSKWTVEDVCSFVEGLSGCSEYARVFREQGIDGETLPLLTEEHLLTTMGLKLGPALKIRAQVARRLGRLLYMASFPVALPLQPPTLQGPEPELPTSPATTSPPYGGAQPPTGLASPRQENGSGTLDPAQTLC